MGLEDCLKKIKFFSLSVLLTETIRIFIFITLSSVEYLKLNFNGHKFKILKYKILRNTEKFNKFQLIEVPLSGTL